MKGSKWLLMGVNGYEEYKNESESWTPRNTNGPEGLMNEHEGSTNEDEGSLRRVKHEGGPGTSSFSFNFSFVFIRVRLFKFPFALTLRFPSFLFLAIRVPSFSFVSIHMTLHKHEGSISSPRRVMTLFFCDFESKLTSCLIIDDLVTYSLMVSF